MIRTAAAALTLLGLCASANAQVVITEIWPGGLSGDEQTPDWFELSNLGESTVTGVDTWFYDDNSFNPTENTPLTGVSEIAPGESVIFLTSWEDDFLTAEEAIAGFTAVWGAENLTDVQIGTVAGGAGLSGGGDTVVIFDSNMAGANIIAQQTYLFADPASWFWNPDTMSWNDELSVIGVFGAIQSVLPAATNPDEAAIGSPGFFDGETVIPIPSDLVITEIWSGGLAGAEAIPDWFELTNFGATPVNFVDTFFYDDDSADPTANSPLSGITSIAPGESVIFLVSWEGGFATAQDAIDAFNAFWPPAEFFGVQVGTVTDGSGLGGGGDAVNIFNTADPDATLIASQGYPVGGFEESYVWNPLSMSWNDELAAEGVFGAFASLFPASDDPTVGPALASPGIIDGAPPEPVFPLTITEIWSGGVAGAEVVGDWFEVTNFGDTTFTGVDTLFYDDESADPTVNDPLVGISEIAPGESVIFIIADAGTEEAEIAAFIDAFGAENLEGVQIGAASDGAGLGNGDAVFLFDGNTVDANIVATQAYISGGTVESWVWNPVTESWNDELAVEGVFGAFASLVNASDDPKVGPIIASPGLVDEPPAPVVPLTITEIWAGGLAGSETIPDWFELTNFNAEPYTTTDALFYDDSSGDATVDDQILGLTDIAPGESVVVLTSLEGLEPAAAIQNFIDVWGAGNLAGVSVQIGYVEDGAGLGGGGDAVFVFNANTAGAGVVATQGYPVAGFPESYVWNPDTMSWNDEIAVVGTFGAFESALPAATAPDESAIGSPGVIDGDATPNPDLDGSGTVDSVDLNILLGDFGCTPDDGDCPGDINGDGFTNSVDLNLLLAAFGDMV